MKRFLSQYDEYDGLYSSHGGSAIDRATVTPSVPRAAAAAQARNAGNDAHHDHHYCDDTGNDHPQSCFNGELLEVAAVERLFVIVGTAIIQIRMQDVRTGVQIFSDRVTALTETAIHSIDGPHRRIGDQQKERRS